MSWLSDDGPSRLPRAHRDPRRRRRAFLAGRGLARGWKPFWRIFFYMALLAAAVRFFHYALFDGDSCLLYYYLVTYVVLFGGGVLGYRMHADDTDGDAISLALRAHEPADLARRGSSRASARSRRELL